MNLFFVLLFYLFITETKTFGIQEETKSLKIQINRYVLYVDQEMVEDNKQ